MGLTMVRGKIPVLLANVLPLVVGLVQDLNVGREILLAPELAEFRKCLVGHLGHVQFVVPCPLSAPNAVLYRKRSNPTYCQQVVRAELLHQLVSQRSIGGCRVAEAGAVMKIACDSRKNAVQHDASRLGSRSPTRVDQQQVDAHAAGLLLQMRGKGHKIPKIGTIYASQSVFS